MLRIVTDLSLSRGSTKYGKTVVVIKEVRATGAMTATYFCLRIVELLSWRLPQRRF